MKAVESKLHELFQKSRVALKGRRTSKWFDLSFVQLWRAKLVYARYKRHPKLGTVRSLSRIPVPILIVAGAISIASINIPCLCLSRYKLIKTNMIDTEGILKDLSNQLYVTRLTPAWAWLYVTKNYLKYSLTPDRRQAKENDLTILSISKNAQHCALANAIDLPGSIFPLVLKVTWGNETKAILTGNSEKDSVLWFFAVMSEADEQSLLGFNINDQ